LSPRARLIEHEVAGHRLVARARVFAAVLRTWFDDRPADAGPHCETQIRDADRGDPPVEGVRAPEAGGYLFPRLPKISLHCDFVRALRVRPVYRHAQHGVQPDRQPPSEFFAEPRRRRVR
jgi:hypothetical protein